MSLSVWQASWWSWDPDGLRDDLGLQIVREMQSYVREALAWASAVEVESTNGTAIDKDI